MVPTSFGAMDLGNDNAAEPNRRTAASDAKENLGRGVVNSRSHYDWLSMDIRQLQYLVALAREKHFTRAAQACNVSQPTLSGRIRQLEQELGVPIVERGQRFHGLTPDGQRVLKWANAILDNWSALQQDIATLRNTSGALTGHL